MSMTGSATAIASSAKASLYSSAFSAPFFSRPLVRAQAFSYRASSVMFTPCGRSLSFAAY